MKDNKKRIKCKYNERIVKSLTILLLIIFCFSVLAILTYNSEMALEFICSLVGGTIAFIGVVITICHERKLNDENLRFLNKPVIYITQKNLNSKLNQIITLEDKNTFSKSAKNYIDLKNSKRSDFWIQEIYEGSNNIDNILKSKVFIEKGTVFRIRIKGNIKLPLIMKVISRDEIEYLYELNYSEIKELE